MRASSRVILPGQIQFSLSIHVSTLRGFEWEDFEEHMQEARRYSDHIQYALDIYERIVGENMHNTGYENEVKSYLSGVGYEGGFESDRPLVWLAENIGVESANLGPFLNLNDIGPHFYHNNFDFGYGIEAQEDVREASEKLEYTVQGVDRTLQRVRGSRKLADEAVEESFLSTISKLLGLNTSDLDRIEKVNRFSPEHHQLRAYRSVDKLDFDELKRAP